jgi:ATP-dependent helicase HrpB
MAQTLGEEPGETIGYVTRLDTKRSGRTRVVVMTEAIFVATILSDPELPGSARCCSTKPTSVISIRSRPCARARSAGVLREDLRVVVMSATLDGARFSALMPGARVIESEGKAHPLEIRWLGAARSSAPIRPWPMPWRPGEEQTGDILGFLPGVRDIERTADPRPAPAFRADPAAARAGRACGPARGNPARCAGRRRIVLATAIAETSLTLDGVCVVVDAGLSRRAEFDKVAGVTRLVTTRASQAAAAQRAGRAARQGPGVAYRLWEEAAHAGRAPSIRLKCSPQIWPRWRSRWRSGGGRSGADGVDRSAARARDGGGEGRAGRARRARRGRADHRPWPGHGAPADGACARAHAALCCAAWRSAGGRAAGPLLQERGLGGSGEDLARRFDRWRGDRGTRAEASRKLAARWARRQQARGGAAGSRPGTVEPPPPVRWVGRAPPQGRRSLLLAEAFPDRIARARGQWRGMAVFGRARLPARSGFAAVTRAGW